MSALRIVIFLCGAAVGAVAMQALPFAVQWRRDALATLHVEKLQATTAPSVDAGFVATSREAGEDLIIKEYKSPFGSDVELRRWKLRAPEDVHRQIERAMIAERGSKRDREFDKAAAFGTRQNVQAIKEIELPSLRAHIGLLNNLIASTKQELVDIVLMRELAVQRSQSTAGVEQAVSAALAADSALKSLRGESTKIDEQLVARRQASRDQNSVELRALQRKRDQIKLNLTKRREIVEAEARKKAESAPNDKLRAAITEYRIRSDSAERRLREYEEALSNANKRMIALQRALDAANQPPTADSSI
ncbi:hypothetical protein [Lacipirellula limnantheis]|uniref:Uncharacterized protein n=1 Tax=Lacipirellula limnantheis TaxID=2528024 RepID=A0A517TY70_9BACT|nr:hypothetical protein [Lacipirellula limnantheis]QDT73316.1 hypothetical protein I41_25050 [Lacipirellula limnantheis]